MLWSGGRAVALVSALLCMGSPAGCSSSSAGSRPQVRPSAPASATSAQPAVEPAVELRCADAGSGTAVANGADVSAGGLTLEGLARGDSDVPRAADLDFRMPAAAAQRHFRKTPADLGPRAGPVTVELVEPADGQALMWVSADQWSSALDPGRWMTTTVTC